MKNSFGCDYFSFRKWGFVFNEGGKVLTLTLLPKNKLPLRLWISIPKTSISFELVIRTW